jgi:very-short-patch-repair endonuclease
VETGTRYHVKVEGGAGKMSKKVPKKLSPGEEAFSLHCRVEMLNPIREYVFYPGRKWRFDFYFPDIKLAVEIEGGTGIYGRHQRPGGFEKDCEKYNSAVRIGIRVLRYTTKMVIDGTAINDVLEIIR